MICHESNARSSARERAVSGVGKAEEGTGGDNCGWAGFPLFGAEPVRELQRIIWLVFVYFWLGPCPGQCPDDGLLLAVPRLAVKR
jgi:hypothetical protein